MELHPQTSKAANYARPQRRGKPIVFDITTKTGFTQSHTPKHQKAFGAKEVCPAIRQPGEGRSRCPPSSGTSHLAQQQAERGPGPVALTWRVRDTSSQFSSHLISWAFPPLAAMCRFCRLQTGLFTGSCSWQGWPSLSCATSTTLLTVLCLQRVSHGTESKHAGVSMTSCACKTFQQPSPVARVPPHLGASIHTYSALLLQLPTGVPRNMRMAAAASQQRKKWPEQKGSMFWVVLSSPIASA